MPLDGLAIQPAHFTSFSVASRAAMRVQGDPIVSRTLLSIGVLQLLVMLASLVRAKVLSVLLGPEGVGIVSTLDQATVTVAQIAALGLPLTAMKFMARAHSESAVEYRQTYAGFLQLIVGTSVVLVASIVFAIYQVPALIPRGLAPYRAYLWLALLGAPAFTLNILFVRTLAASGRSSAAGGLMAIQGIAVGVVAIGSAWVGGVAGLYEANFVLGVLGIVGTTYWLSKRLDLSPFTRSSAAVRHLLRNAEIGRNAALTYIMLVAFAVTMLVTRYIALLEIGEAGTGRMQAQMSIALSIGALLAAFSGLHVAPLLNRNVSVSEKTATADRFLSLTLLTFAAGSLPILLFPDLVVRILYSSAFISSATALVLFVLWQLLYQFNTILQQLLIGLDDLFVCTFAVVGGLALAIALCIPLALRWHAAGVAVSLIAGTATTGAVMLARLRSQHAYYPSTRVSHRMLAGIGIAGTGILVSFGPPELTGYGILLRATVAVVLLAGLLRLLAATERTQLSELLTSWLPSAAGH